MCLAVPGIIEETFEKDGVPMAMVRFGSISRSICLACTPEAKVGEYVLVHVGIALAVIDAEEAARSLALLQASGAIIEFEDEISASAVSESEVSENEVPRRI
jgi:hydrogenase expression/formation protein HypC